MERICRPTSTSFSCRGADKSLARPERSEARKHAGDARDFNNIGTRTVISFFFLQGKASKEIQAIMTEILACFLPGKAKDLSVPPYISPQFTRCIITPTTPFPLYDKATHSMTYNLKKYLRYSASCSTLNTQTNLQPSRVPSARVRTA